ncbi:hypothetical protein A3I27_02215 [Candidatus Giovannonibacteria bacterium RIFCSPLOWO2_02_FULL_43_11b]|uniref:Uncharacterized protein n=1 Tax=Candidatus Giovannonibacteria bacterium RIFCSPHIGHO2_12_FULL_43_15 TaxID=1798341 RepID=A0A1F5WQD2_9BACT|nr:MAG: hypothetical protein A2739_02600 [Candidatus Giovannonibacteria bacterium RIFCSPHIGHO2_01_FULL_43_100]OGF67309.1 MAG: hypothetical protein A3B97_03305 [Candidatus Giovannonibacteria bacterium RIFCSPHIGHO2_02_FULL_43_32]OGF77797.1 MAG: hypothetical protein A3F23_04185 [Candidatus Giovannonibacteria bacterium RIFCSPHIGHO2_12_FULL_43_15]OGF78590.1 MAG: hypothetical protein A3A15_01365 [Candidatus Giovannonibacteria bacterium RIFCSPLOWO2_01_FULL_43_60]OGF90027.1 MAG: hypothetical protein A3
MATVTIPKTKYNELLEAIKKLESISKPLYYVTKKKSFTDNAFGALKRSFSNKSSVFYVGRMRKSWRQ